MRKVFFSFHYKLDCWRTSQVRHIGTLEGNSVVSDNDWETITDGDDQKVRDWIDSQLVGRSCLIVLVGENTASRKWVRYEISKAWSMGKGVVGINIHGLKNSDGETASLGLNPFDYVNYGDDEKELSNIVKRYNPPGKNSGEKYEWISDNIEKIIEKAIEIRDNN